LSDYESSGNSSQTHDLKKVGLTVFAKNAKRNRC